MTTNAETAGPETLTQLVGEVAGEGRRLTFVQLAARSIDPDTGYKPSPNLLWRVATGGSIKVNPELVRAIAAGIEQPLERVQAAAAYQFVGYVAVPLAGGHAVHMPGASAGDSPKSRAIMERWDEEESPDPGNHSSQ